MTHQTTPEHALRAYVGAFVDELARAGIEHVCVSPGSRSTPLALLLAEQSAIRLWMHYDERSAGFFALGMARASRRPVALLCTSGTAAANYMPAVVEAYHARVPLVVLTADRPPELRDVGAPQTIDQFRIYGSHAKWSVDALLPEATPDALRYVRSLAGRAVATALAEPRGPVHLNLPFREPLVPAPAPPAGPTPVERPDEPYVRVATAPRTADPATVDGLARRVLETERGLIVCGPQDDPELAAAAAELARASGFPLLADPLSGVRCGRHDRSLVLDAYDAFLRDADFAAAHPPSLVIRLGAMPTSKPVLLYLQRHPGCRQVVVDPGAGWQEPTLLAAEHLHADPVHLCRAVAAGLGAARSSGWLEAWLAADCAAGEAIAEQLASQEEPSEPRAFAELAELLPEGATLYVGNSMPVRDLDTFFPSVGRELRILGNRGANGIDGVVSSALGAGAVSPGPLLLAIGDLSFYHDLNGLLAAKLHQLDATILLLNNDGGGIFSFLPQAASPEHFELLFGTPHGLDFRPAVEMYGGRFERVMTWPAFRAALRDALGAPGLNVVELPTSRAENVRQHRAIWPAVATRLRACPATT